MSTLWYIHLRILHLSMLQLAVTKEESLQQVLDSPVLQTGMGRIVAHSVSHRVIQNLHAMMMMALWCV